MQLRWRGYANVRCRVKLTIDPSPLAGPLRVGLGAGWANYLLRLTRVSLRRRSRLARRTLEFR